MKVNIHLKSGKEINLNHEDMIERTDDTSIKYITYRKYDDYYHGDSAYRGTETILKISISEIELINYNDSIVSIKGVTQ